MHCVGLDSELVCNVGLSPFLPTEFVWNFVLIVGCGLVGLVDVFQERMFCGICAEST